MLTATVALGGTDLHLQRVWSDWADVRGIAYHCPFGRPERVISEIVRARGWFGGSGRLRGLGLTIEGALARLSR